jgi:hypothetical protein
VSRHTSGNSQKINKGTKKIDFETPQRKTKEDQIKNSVTSKEVNAKFDGIN